MLCQTGKKKNKKALFSEKKISDALAQVSVTTEIIQVSA
jgi:hypothetical protein